MDKRRKILQRISGVFLWENKLPQAKKVYYMVHIASNNKFYYFIVNLFIRQQPTKL